jgi:aminoglycoside 6'-N-acetyltransferase I
MNRENIIVKLLSNRDAAVLDNVDDDVFDHSIRADSVRAFFNDPSNLIAVAIDNGVVVGMASAFSYIHPDKPLQLFVNEVGVSRTHQRRGLGKKLVRLILERGQELGCEEAWVATEEENAPARRLFLTLGGEEDPSLAAVYTYALQPVKKS